MSCAGNSSEKIDQSDAEVQVLEGLMRDDVQEESYELQ